MKLATIILLWLLLPRFAEAQGWSGSSPRGGIEEGDSATLYPFSYGYTRYQQVYSANGFSSPIGPGGIYLQAMYFRLDSPNGFPSIGYPTNLQINLSTTLQQPDSLSPVFSENVGANDRVVFGPATPRLVFDHAGGQPQAWDTLMRLGFSEPFFYRPSDGNLLVDIRLFDGSTAGNWLDAWNQTGDAVSSVYGAIGDSSGTATTLGLETLFEGTLVPEPSTYALFALGTAALLLLRKKRKS